MRNKTLTLLLLILLSGTANAQEFVSYTSALGNCNRSDFIVYQNIWRTTMGKIRVKDAVTPWTTVRLSACIKGDRRIDEKQISYAENYQTVEVAGFDLRNFINPTTPQPVYIRQNADGTRDLVCDNTTTYLHHEWRLLGCQGVDENELAFRKRN